MKAGQPFNPKGLFNGTFIPDCIAQHPDLSLSAKFLLCRIYRYAHKDGVAYAKQERLAQDLGVSVIQIQRLIKTLVEQRFIRVERSGEDMIQHKTNRYIPLWHEIFNESITLQNDVSQDYIDDASQDYIDDGSKDNIDDGSNKETNRRDKNLKHNNKKEYTRIIFDEFFSLYPKREGANPKEKAFRAFQARLKEGVNPQDIINGVKRYAEYCNSKFKPEERCFIKQACFWLSADYKGWEQEWNYSKNSAIPKWAQELEESKRRRENG